MSRIVSIGNEPTMFGNKKNVLSYEKALKLQKIKLRRKQNYEQRMLRTLLEALESLRDFKGLSSRYSFYIDSHINRSVDFDKIINGKCVMVKRIPNNESD